MLDVVEALSVVLESARPARPVSVPLSDAILGQILAAEVRADRDSPPFAKSLRDGYAVRAADCQAANPELLVVAEIPAGAIPSRTIHAGECARIFTGVPIPPGADAIVMQEETSELADRRVRIQDQVKPGQWIFPQGHEMRAGDVVLAAGTRVNPAAVGLLATLGAAEVVVYPRPRVAVLATGDELVQVGSPLHAGQIRNSNGPMLAAQAAQTVGTVQDLGIARDDAGSLQSRIGAAISVSDVVILAGGVSVGKFDLVPNVLAELGLERHFHQVRMKPGKPLYFGTRHGTLVFGLPGNPVSAFVSFELFVRPALDALMGEADPGPRIVPIPLAEALAESNDRPTYRPAKLEPTAAGWAVRPLPWAGAPDLRGLQPADALIVLPPGDSRYDSGTPINVVLLGPPIRRTAA